MKPPNAENSFVDLEKLRTYAPDPTYRVGRHKARLFAALLGLGVEDAAELCRTCWTLGEDDEHEHRYRINFMLTWRGREALVRSAWIVRPEEGFPSLVTCYPLAGEGE